MTTLKRFCGTGLLLVLFAIPGLAGESSMPGVPTPPPSNSQAETPAPTAEDPTGSATSDSVELSSITLDLLGRLLVVLL